MSEERIKEMSNSFQEMLKKNRMSFDDISKKIKEDRTGGAQKDERMWYPQLDENKNGQAVIRFLPPAEGEDSPWVKRFSHGFKDKGGWFIEECPTTIKGECPVCIANGELWNSGIDSDKEIARKRKRKYHYFANILVVEDKKNPENEGKVFIFRFGAKIFEKISGAMHPEFDDEQQINPFDFLEGANFKLKIRKVDGMVNYDRSEFTEPSRIAEKIEDIEAIWKKEYKLQELIAPSIFKDPKEIAKKFARVTGISTPTTTANELANRESDPSNDVDDSPFKDEPAKSPKELPKEESPFVDDEEDPMKMFNDLLNED